MRWEREIRSHWLIKTALVVRRWLWKRFVNRSQRSHTPVVHWKDQHGILSDWNLADVSFATEKLSTLLVKELVDDEGNAWRASEHTMLT